MNTKLIFSQDLKFLPHRIVDASKVDAHGKYSIHHYDGKLHKTYVVLFHPCGNVMNAWSEYVASYDKDIKLCEEHYKNHLNQITEHGKNDILACIHHHKEYFTMINKYGTETTQVLVDL